MATYIYHHGIKNQKWGVRNGPPYPLNRSKDRQVKEYKKAEKRILSLDEKNEAINIGDAKLVFNNYEQFTNEELKRLNTRMTEIKKLKDSTNYRAKGFSYVNSLLKNADDVEKIVFRSIRYYKYGKYLTKLVLLSLS